MELLHAALYCICWTDNSNKNTVKLCGAVWIWTNLSLSQTSSTLTGGVFLKRRLERGKNPEDVVACTWRCRRWQLLASVSWCWAHWTRCERTRHRNTPELLHRQSNVNRLTTIYSVCSIYWSILVHFMDANNTTACTQIKAVCTRPKQKYKYILISRKYKKLIRRWDTQAWRFLVYDKMINAHSL